VYLAGNNFTLLLPINGADKQGTVSSNRLKKTYE